MGKVTKSCPISNLRNFAARIKITPRSIRRKSPAIPEMPESQEVPDYSILSELRVSKSIIPLTRSMAKGEDWKRVLRTISGDCKFSSGYLKFIFTKYHLCVSPEAKVIFNIPAASPNSAKITVAPMVEKLVSRITFAGRFRST